MLEFFTSLFYSVFIYLALIHVFKGFGILFFALTDNLCLSPMLLIKLDERAVKAAGVHVAA